MQSLDTNILEKDQIFTGKGDQKHDCNGRKLQVHEKYSIKTIWEKLRIKNQITVSSVNV